LITGADISEPANLGAGLVIISPPGVAIMGRSGVNLTVMPCSGMGAEIGRYEDIGAGPGCCVVGDDVLLEPHSGVLGPVRVGNRVTIGSGVSVAKDVPDDYKVEGPKPRFLARKDLSIWALTPVAKHTAITPGPAPGATSRRISLVSWIGLLRASYLRKLQHAKLVHFSGQKFRRFSFTGYHIFYAYEAGDERQP
jgi:hypothetical protein